MHLQILKNSLEIAYARVSFFIKLQTKVWNFIENETLAQVISREFSKTFKSSYFFNTPGHSGGCFRPYLYWKPP